MKWATAILVGAHVLGLGQAVLYAASFDITRRERASRVLLSDDALRANDLNNLAWGFVIDENTSRQTLELAELAARRAVERQPNEPAFRDTLATALYRVNKFDEAIENERRALAERPDTLMASQLSRFLVARLERDGPILGYGVEADSLDLELTDPDEKTGEPKHVRLQLEDPFDSGVTIFALLRRGDELLGMLQIAAGPNPKSEHLFDLKDRAIEESLAGTRIRLDIALVDTGATTLEAGALDWKLWDHNREVDGYP